VPATTLAVLNPTSEGQTSLPGAALEGGLLTQVLGTDHVTELRETEATLKAVVAAMVGMSHLHLSMHGYFAPNRPDQSALLLAGKDRLTLGDLQDLDAAEALRLVVLSACDSGLSGLQRGKVDEFIGLPAGFLQAGAAAVIASHWPVRDDATFFLMWRFYREYLDSAGRPRRSPADALRASSLWLRDVTLGDLAELFEPARDAEGDIPHMIDRSRPRRMAVPANTNELPTVAPVQAAMRGPKAAPRNRSGSHRKGPIDALLYRRIETVLKSNPAAYPLAADVSNPRAHRPFADPTFWAAFSITGM
jgi:CHAT domain-containing protein